MYYTAGYRQFMPWGQTEFYVLYSHLFKCPTLLSCWIQWKFYLTLKFYSPCKVLSTAYLLPAAVFWLTWGQINDSSVCTSNCSHNSELCLSPDSCSVRWWDSHRAKNGLPQQQELLCVHWNFASFGQGSYSQSQECARLEAGLRDY